MASAVCEAEQLAVRGYLRAVAEPSGLAFSSGSGIEKDAFQVVCNHQPVSGGVPVFRAEREFACPHHRSTRGRAVMGVQDFNKVVSIARVLPTPKSLSVANNLRVRPP